MNNAGFLRVLSAVLAGFAVMFFVVTIVLIVKYKIISSLRLEIMSGKKGKPRDLADEEEKITGTISVQQSVPDEETGSSVHLPNPGPSETDEYCGTVPASDIQFTDDAYMGTIPAEVQTSDNDEIFGTVPASMFSDDSINTAQKLPQTDPDEFVIQTEIIIVHADTAPINH